MIVTMKPKGKGSNVLMVENAIAFLTRRGADVQVCDNGELLIAALGSDASFIDPLRVRELGGVADVDTSNAIFLQRHQEFTEAHQYLTSINQKGVQG